MLRRWILGISLFGTLLFAAVFALTFLNPLLIERAAREIVRIEVEQKTHEKIDALTDGRVVNLARRALHVADSELVQLKQDMERDVPRKVAEVVAGMLKPDCPCRQRVLDFTTRAYDDKIASVTHLRETLVARIESIYGRVTGKLLREVRIFSAANATVFALLGLLTLTRRNETRQLLLPCVVMVGAVLISSAIYLFGQNWLHTIIFGDYVGLAYLLYLALAAALLADVVFNRGRVSQVLTQAVFAVAGGVVGAGC
jgi:hypothetical protein